MLLANLLFAAVGCIIAYLTFKLSQQFKNAGSGMFEDLCWLLDRTPALDAFLVFIFEAVVMAGVLIASLACVSNHAVISFDILFFISLLMLVMFHLIKDTGYSLVKSA